MYIYPHCFSTPARSTPCQPTTSLYPLRSTTNEELYTSTWDILIYAKIQPLSSERTRIV